MSDQEDLGGGISASEDEDDLDVRRHAKLLDAISSLDGKKKVQLSERTVPVQHVSEFTFTSADKKKVALHELVGSLKETASHGELKKQLRSVQKKKTVSVPLPSQEKQKIERTVAYEKTSKDVSKWDPIVKENRKAEQIIYPLERSTISVHTTDSFVKRFQPRTPLEMEVAAALAGSQNVPKKNKELTPAEEKAIKAMSLEEAKERRAELMKYRALLSYKEAKARWQGKIKSKKYHRILKKEKLKNEKRALEELQQNDPEEYQQKMDGVEKQRIQERMSLKHRGGSKFARKQMMYSKYDEQARQQVQDMLQKSRELTQKQRVVSDSEDEEEGVPMDPEDELVMTAMGDNPWMEAGAGKIREYSRPQTLVNTGGPNGALDNEEDGEEDVEETGLHPSKDSVDEKQISRNSSTVKADENSEEEDNMEIIFKPLEEKSLKKTSPDAKNSQAVGEKGKKKKKRKKKAKSNQEAKNDRDVASRKRKFETKDTEEIDDDDDDDEEEDDLMDEGLTRVKTLEDIESKKLAMNDDAEHTVVKKRRKNKKRNQKDMEKSDTPGEAEEVYVDPKKLFTVETKLKSAIPNVTGHDDDDDALDSDDQQRMTIAQAFEDDDVIEEFKQEKQEIVDRDKPKDIDLTLPGWGSWGGTGIKPKRKNKRFIIKAPPAPPRKDKSLGNVIISELKDKAISKYQVSDLPFPYGDIKQFEQSIRAPVGKTWNPETAFKQLIKPKVVTKLGKVINPIDKDEVFKKQKVGNQIPSNAQTEQSKGHGKKRRKR